MNLKHNNFKTLCLIFCLIILGNNSLKAQTPDLSTFPEDISIKIKSATASQYQPNENIDKSYDGNFSTLYHSPYYSTKFPITLTYNFDANDIDYINYTTRLDGNDNGNFKAIEVNAKYSGSSTYQKVYSTDLGGKNGTFKLEFENRLKNVTSIQIVVKSGAGNFASCSEMGFYKINPKADAIYQLFSDKSCSALKPNTTIADINKVDNQFIKTLATDIFNKSYKEQFRLQSYKAWPNPADFSRENGVGTYSLCDNPTGIYANKGDKLVVFVDNTHGYNISLHLKDYSNDNTEGDGFWNESVYSLKDGINKIEVEKNGLFYLYYHTPNHLTAPHIKVHFAYGKVNGYFDSQKNTAADWSKLLNGAKHPYFDVLGQYAHLSFPTDKFKQNTKNNGLALINLYDDLVYAEREFIGYYKYPNRNPYNRSHFVVMYHSYMYSAGNHTGYHVNTLDGLTNVDGLKRGPWGPAHEVGHSNQHTPILKWVGTTEVTNNIQSAQITNRWGNVSRLTFENRFQEAFDDIITPKLAHCQADIWRKLIPFWQLELFFSNVLGRTDFYSEVYEACRQRKNTSHSAGEHQLNFVKIVVDSAKVDLTDFFENWGFLKPVNQKVEDYWTEQLTITKAQSEGVKNYIKNKKFEILPYKIQYITDTNWKIYKNKLNVVKGTAKLSDNGIYLYNWQNAVAYEVYKDDKLIKVVASDYWANNKSNKTTNISIVGRFDKSYVAYAIQYDGKKIEILRGSGEPIEILKPEPNVWYYIKNMASSEPRSLWSLNATNENNIIRGTLNNIFKTQKWKLEKRGNKFAIVNEAGLYLNKEMKASKSASYIWDIDSTNYGKAIGYRFVTKTRNPEKPSEILTIVAHLGLNGNLMNYTNSDEASIWQFVKADITADKTSYKITTLRGEKEISGMSLVSDGETLKMGKTETFDWKFANLTTETGAINIQNSENNYIYTLGARTKMSDKKKPFFIFIKNYNGIPAYQFSTSNSIKSSTLNTNKDGDVTITSQFNIGSLWSIHSDIHSAVNNVSSNKNSPKTWVNSGKIYVENGDNFSVYNISGQKVKNRNLANGIYIIKGEKFILKILVN